MARKKLQFGIGVTVILAAVAYFAISGFQEGKSYYSTIDELQAMGSRADGKRLRVAGVVKPGTVTRTGRALTFQLAQESQTLDVRYTGSAPVPDTFKDGAEAIVEGERRADGSFEADHIQAKCASKYEAKYGSDAKHPADVPMK